MHEDPITMAQERLAIQYKLSRQVAMMLALLVSYPTVTTTTIKHKIGSVDEKNLVSRLRRKLKQVDDTVFVRTAYGFGYYIDEQTRRRIAIAADLDYWPMQVPAVSGKKMNGTYVT